MIDLDALEQAFQESLQAHKGIFARLKGWDRDVFVYWIDASEGDLLAVDLLDYTECHMWGEFNDEMITSDDGITCWGMLSDEDKQIVADAILNRAQWQEFKFAEVEDDYPIGHKHHTDRMYIVKDGEELPRGATGKFLRQEGGKFFYI